MADQWMLKRICDSSTKSFLVHNGISYNYQNLSNEINLCYELIIKNGVITGSIVAIVADYSFRSIACFLALVKNKNIIVPITTKISKVVKVQLKEAFVDWVITLPDSKLSIKKVSIDKDKHSLINDIQQKKASGLVLFTSGSTGKPKAMIHNLDVLIDSFKDTRLKKMRILVFLMFDHIGGINTLLKILASASTMVVPTSRDADEIAKLIQENKVMVLPTTPTFLNLMLINDVQNKYDLNSLKIISYGTEPMPKTLLIKLRECFKGVRLIQTFGTSETGISRTASKSSDSTMIKLDDPDIEHKIVSDELWLRSKTQIMGYLNHNMESFTEDGWFKTGDLVMENKDGYLTIVGRNKEVINIGGEKVLPIEVESVLLEMPEVLDCIVYAEKNAITGEAVATKVTLTNTISPSELRKRLRVFCKGKIEPFKIPSRIKVVDKASFNERYKKIRITSGENEM